MVLTRQEKRERRRRILAIIGDRSVEELSDQELKFVQEIAGTIGADTIDESKPLPNMDLEEFTYEEYERLVELGYAKKSIYRALGISQGKLYRWLEENQPVSKIQQKIDLTEMKTMKLSSDFKLFEFIGISREPSITISKYGLNFSLAAADYLKRVAYVKVYVNEKEKQIAFLSAKKEDNGAVRFFREENSTYKNPIFRNAKFLEKITEMCGFDLENKTYYVKPEVLEDGQGVLLDLEKAEEKERRIFGRGE